MADILWMFNWFTKKSVQYKPFHNQLAKPNFPEFLRRVLLRCLSKLSCNVLSVLPGIKLAQFRDILLHDGSSFALKNTLAKTWPGRFTKVSPAAVELHVTMSVFENNPVCITIAPDKESERHFVPRVADVCGRLLIEDRGYEDRTFFQAIKDAAGHFLIRGKTNIKPMVCSARDARGQRLPYLEGKKLSWRKLPRQHVPRRQLLFPISDNDDSPSATVSVHPRPSIFRSTSFGSSR